MGWEYDGDEDAFNEFCKTNSKDDFYYGADESIRGIESAFLDTLLIHIHILKSDGYEGLDRLHKLDVINSNYDQQIKYVKKSAQILFYDSEGDYIQHRDEYMGAISNSMARNKRSRCLDIHSRIIEKFLKERNEILKRKLIFVEETQGMDPIGRLEGLFNFEFDFSFLLKNEPSIAVKILSLAYASEYYAREWNAEREYIDHILPDVNDITPIETIIQRVATKLNCEGSLSLTSDCLEGYFSDGSSFELYPVLRPKEFECTDNYDLDHEVAKINEAYQDYNLFNDHADEIDIIEFIETKVFSNTARKLASFSQEKMNVSITIPTKHFAGLEYFKDFKDDKDCIPNDIEFSFKIQRSPVFQKTTADKRKAEIMKAKEQTTLDQLIQEGLSILD